MSAYSEWKHGLITDAEYASICKAEAYWEKYYEEHPEEFDEEVFEEDDIDEF